MKKMFYSGVLLVLSACATTGFYNDKLNELVGKPESVLIAEWGMPGHVSKLNNQEEIITYTKQNQEIIPPEYNFYNPNFDSMGTLYAPFSYQEDFVPLSTEPGYVIENICQTSFHVKNGIIQSWQWRGNDCTAY